MMRWTLAALGLPLLGMTLWVALLGASTETVHAANPPGPGDGILDVPLPGDSSESGGGPARIAWRTRISDPASLQITLPAEIRRKVFEVVLRPGTLDAPEAPLELRRDGRKKTGSRRRFRILESPPIPVGASLLLELVPSGGESWSPDEVRLLREGLAVTMAGRLDPSRALADLGRFRGISDAALRMAGLLILFLAGSIPLLARGLVPRDEKQEV